MQSQSRTKSLTFEIFTNGNAHTGHSNYGHHSKSRKQQQHRRMRIGMVIFCVDSFIRSLSLFFVFFSSFVCSFACWIVLVFSVLLLFILGAHLSLTHFHFAFSFGVIFASFAFVTLTIFTLLNGFDIYLCILMCSSICHL